MTRTRWCSSLALGAMCLSALAADAQTLSRGYSTTESGSYVNVRPRQRMAQAPLIQAPRTAPADDRRSRASSRTVVCGTTMLRGDNAVDQKMVLTAPEGGIRGGKARPYALPMCADAKTEPQRR